MKIIKYICLVLVVVLIASCKKNVIEYMATPVGSQAEFQLHFMNPVTSVSTNNITKVEINGQLYANSKAPLATYNAIPSGAVGRFFTVAPGSVNIKMYQGTNMDVLVYDKNVTMTVGKQNIFVHDFTKDPVLFNTGYPFKGNTTEKTDSTAWIKFYNFLYETAALGPTALKLQYQYVDYRTNQPVNIGKPVAFGESTGWEPVTVVKDNNISQGSRLMSFKIKTVDANGNIVGDLSIMGTGGTYAAYTATSTLGIARRYHHIMSGFRAFNAPNSAVRIFTAL
jgi:hypothetical protein